MAFPLFLSPVFARELELRRETVAVMRLRGSLERRARTLRASSQCAGQPSPVRASRVDGVPSIRILSICDYDGLRLAREMLLNQEGYRAHSCTSSDSLDPFAMRSFQIALLCHSVAQEHAIRIADTLHRHNSRIQVLRICESEPSRSPCFDTELESFCGPARLLAAIRETVSRGGPAHLPSR